MNFLFSSASPLLTRSLSPFPSCPCDSHTDDVQRKWKYCVQTIYLICCCCLRAWYLQMELQANANLRCLMFMPFLSAEAAISASSACYECSGGTKKNIWFDCIISIGNENSLNLLPLSMSGWRERLVFIFIHFISFIIFCCAHFAGIPYSCSVSAGVLRTCNHGTDIFCCHIHFFGFCFFTNRRRAYTACTHIDYYLFIQMKTIFWRPEPFSAQALNSHPWESTGNIYLNSKPSGRMLASICARNSFLSKQSPDECNNRKWLWPPIVFSPVIGLLISTFYSNWYEMKNHATEFFPFYRWCTFSAIRFIVMGRVHLLRINNKYIRKIN